MTANAKPQQDPAQRYQVIKKIDAGGMAEIFLAKSVSIQGMEKHVGVAVPVETERRRDLDTAEHQPPARHQPVHVVALPDA